MEQSAPSFGKASLSMKIIRADGTEINLGTIKGPWSLRMVNRRIRRANKKLQRRLTNG